LLEAGGWDRDPWIHIPLGWGKILQHRLHDWGYFGEPESRLDARAIECARGKVIGGSSSINAMAYVRGHRQDYDAWADAGLRGWSYADVLPYFKRQESWEEGGNSYRGGDGPLGVRWSRYQDPLVEAYMEAGSQAGHPTTLDYNGAQQEGFGRLQLTLRSGKRCSAADAYLRPSLQRPNLHVTVNAFVERLDFEGSRCVGVTYRRRDGQTRSVRAQREVILAGGAINSPQLLMLAGIGDPAELAELGIAVRVGSPGVGKNLQDHLVAMVAYSRREPGPFQKNLRFDRIAWSLAKAQFVGKGFATELPTGVMAFIKTEHTQAVPDTQLLFHAGPLAAAPYLPPFKPAFQDGFSCRAVLLRPESKGRITLSNADPQKAAKIQWNFLSTDRDKKTLREAFKAMRAVARQPSMRQFVGQELIPGADVKSDEQIDAHIRHTAITAHHPLGTCMMGPSLDENAVVDLEMRVFGVDALRVVDASVLPGMIGGNINAAVIMAAEKAADMIRGHRQLSPRQD